MLRTKRIPLIRKQKNQIEKEFPGNPVADQITTEQLPPEEKNITKTVRSLERPDFKASTIYLLNLKTILKRVVGSQWLRTKPVNGFSVYGERLLSGALGV